MKFSLNFLASIRATVDGGTNIWYKFSQSVDNEINNPIPDLVTGDFDSAEPRCLNFYRMHGAKVIHTPDEDETDFNKCVRQVCTELAGREMKVIFLSIYFSCFDLEFHNDYVTFR